MNKTKLVKLLKTFSKTEVIKFREFVNSPFYNKNQKVIKLCDAVLNYYPEFDSVLFNEENLFKVIYENESYNYFKIKNVLSDIYQLSLAYLKIIAGNKNNVRNDLNLLSELHERKLDSIYDQTQKQIKTYLENLKVKDDSDYYNVHRLAAINTSHFKFEKSNYTFDLIQKEFDTFLEHSLSGLLKYYSKMLTNINHGNIQFDLKMFDPIWQYVRDKDFPDNTTCLVYKHIIELELSKSEINYRKLSEILSENSEKLSSESIYFILLVLNSYAAFKLKQGDETFYPERFKITNEFVERKYYQPDYILFMNFISSYTSACMADQYEWAEKFAAEFRNGISPADEKENTINYCTGFLHYRKKNFDKALEYFSKINFKLFLAKIMVRSYTIRALYESNLHEQTLSAIDGFRHYLKNENLIDEQQKKSYFDFLKYLTELTKLKSENLKDRKDKRLIILKNEINNLESNSLGIKNWLIDKAGNFF